MLYAFGFIGLIVALALAKGARFISGFDVVTILVSMPIVAVFVYFFVPLLRL